MDHHTHEIATAAHQQPLPSDGCDFGGAAGADFLGDLVPSMAEITEGSGSVEGLADFDAAMVLAGDGGGQDVAIAADEARAELVTAEVAAVLSLIAYDYFSSPIVAAIRNGTASKDVLPLRNDAGRNEAGRDRGRDGAKVGDAPQATGCQIIAFPVPRR